MKKNLKPFNGIIRKKCKELLKGIAIVGVLGFSSSVGAQTYFDSPTVATGNHEVATYHTCDIDGDNDLDILTGIVTGSKVAWFKNNGQGGFTLQQTISSTNTDGYNTVDAADLDNDGDLDAISTIVNKNKIVWYENTDGNGLFGAEQIIVANTTKPSDIYVCDINKDGKVDILYSNDKDTIAWIENLGSGIFGSKRIISTTVEDPIGLYASDLDGDNDLDILCSDFFEDYVVWYENTDGAGSFSAKKTIDANVNAPTSIYVADIDGDNDNDVLVANQDYHGKIKWYENNGSGVFSSAISIGSNMTCPCSVYACDLDKDGDNDVIGSSWQDKRIAWIENEDAAGTFSAGNTISTVYSSPWYVRACDIDGDGWEDIIFRPNDKKLRWYKNNTLQIISQPSNQSVYENALASFDISTENAQTYQWQVNKGLGFEDIVDGSTYSGSTTNSLSINTPTLNMNGYIYQCIASNSAGSKTSNTATLTVNVDNIAPVPDVANLTDITSECGINILSYPTATDNSAGTVIATTTDPLSYANQGTYTITWTYDDGNGNTATQTQNVIIDDVTAPVADVASLPDVTGECSATIASAPTATDNCAGSITATTNAPLSYSDQGNYSITWTYDDGNGNTATQTQNVIIDDVTAPVADIASLPDVTGGCSVSIASPPTATDNCAGSITATTNNPLSYSDQGNYSITWTYDDGNGNTATQTQNVIIDDVTAPVADIASLPDVTGECSVTIASQPTATDNCAGSITATTNDPLSYSDQGNYSITWTYDDGNGNTATQTQNVIVDDVTKPTITCPTDQTVKANNGNTYTVTGISLDPTSTNDNCAIESVSNSHNNNTSLDGANFSIGTHTITWTITDIGDNTSECTFDLTVEPQIGISSVEFEKISVYPNPTRNKIYLETNSVETLTKVEIMDITGKILLSESFNDKKVNIDVSSFKEGIYFIKAITAKQSYTTKFLKK